jgi:hypothetical protein
MTAVHGQRCLVRAGVPCAIWKSGRGSLTLSNHIQMYKCLLGRVQTLIFTLVSSIVERMGDLVHPHAASILSWLPEVWQNSEGQGLLRMQARSFSSPPDARILVVKLRLAKRPE